MVINPIVYDERKGNDIFSKNLENRVIHLVGEVNDEMAASIVAQLLYLSSISSEDIQLYITALVVRLQPVWQSTIRCSTSVQMWLRFVLVMQPVWER